MINPEGPRTGPIRRRIPEQLFRLLIDIGEFGDICAAAPQNDLGRLHQLPVALLAEMTLRRFRPSTKRAQVDGESEKRPT